MLKTIDATGVVHKSPTSKVVRKKLDAGQSIPPHNHPGEDVLIQVTSGALKILLDDQPFEVQAGELVQFDGDLMVTLEATLDQTVFVVFVVKR